MYRLLYSFFWLLSHTPFRVLYVISDILYYPLYYIVRYRRGIVRKNLIESFPDKSVAEIKRIERDFYHFFCDMALESCKLLTIAPEEMKRRMRFVNIDEANAMLAAGKSISAFIGHYGNWEWLSSIGLWMHENSDRVQIYHKLRNKAMDRFMIELRGRMGNKCVDMYATARYMHNAAKGDKPQIIGFIADQSPKKKEVKHFLNFLNHRVPVLTGTERLTKHFGYEAMYISMRRIKRGYYECEFTFLPDNPRSLPDFELTALYYKRLEQDIRKQPELYLWTHKRFKHAVAIDQETI